MRGLKLTLPSAANPWRIVTNFAPCHMLMLFFGSAVEGRLRGHQMQPFHPQGYAL